MNVISAVFCLLIGIQCVVILLLIKSHMQTNAVLKKLFEQDRDHASKWFGETQTAKSRTQPPTT